VALPVYEIYKAGQDAAWVDGLDVLARIGIDAAVIPHYDNTEGGTHDTRYCYMGERRLRMLERALPPEVAVLGIDEHTALLFDLERETLTVRGRGGLTVRRNGDEMRLAAPHTMPLREMRRLLSAPLPAAGADQQDPPLRGGEPAVSTLDEAARTWERRFEAAERARDARSMAEAVINLHSALVAWAADTDVDVAEIADTILRSMVVRLGRFAQAGLDDPVRRLRPLVEPVVAMRERFRSEGQWLVADRLRDALTAGGIEVRDTREGTVWDLAPTASPARDSDAI
jgi:hypothetical protein